MKSTMLEVFGSLIAGFAQSCVNLGIVAGLQAEELVNNIDPLAWYPLEHFHKLQQYVFQSYANAADILEMVGASMMNLWYQEGPGKEIISGGMDFLTFQSGSDGYASVIRGPKEIVGSFELVKMDQAAGTAEIWSTTPFDLDMERGIIIGGMLAPGDLKYVKVSDENADEKRFIVRFHFFETAVLHKLENLVSEDIPDDLELKQDEYIELLWLYKSLERKFNRDRRFWTATNKSLSNAFNKLEKQNQEVAETFYKAGIADATVDVVHNVGNSANSLVTSTELLKQFTHNSKTKEAARIINLLVDHSDDLSQFLLKDEMGSKIIEYGRILSESLKEEKKRFISELDRIEEGIDSIRNILNLKRAYSEDRTVIEHFNLTDILEGTLRLSSNLFRQNGIQVIRNYAADAIFVIAGHKSQLISVLIEIFKNSIEAMMNTSEHNRTLTLDVTKLEDNVSLKISDNGEGIAPENFKKVFNHGFSTKADHCGFGLHNCANYINGMGASIEITQSRIQVGTSITITF